MNQLPVVITLALLVAFLASLATFHPSDGTILLSLASGCLTGLFAFLQVKKD